MSCYFSSGARATKKLGFPQENRPFSESSLFLHHCITPGEHRSEYRSAWAGFTLATRTRCCWVRRTTIPLLVDSPQQLRLRLHTAQLLCVVDTVTSQQSLPSLGLPVESWPNQTVNNTKIKVKNVTKALKLGLRQFPKTELKKLLCQIKLST